MEDLFDEITHVFENESVLTDDYDPVELPERTEEMKRISRELQPAVRGESPRNMLIYGKAGQGKTATVDTVLHQLEGKVREEHQKDDSINQLNVVRYNCSNDTSSYTVLTGLVKKFCGESMHGHPHDEIRDRFFEELTNIGGTVTIVLDEVDNIGTKDEILYNISRAGPNERIPDDMHLSVIGISNDLDFKNRLSSKVKDSLKPEEINFPSYDANQLRSITRRRGEMAFRDDTLTDGAVAICAAYAGKDKGSARQALRILYKAGQIAGSHNDEQVTEKHIKEANEEINLQMIREGIQEMSLQDNLALAGVIVNEMQGNSPSKTKDVYEQYCLVAEELGKDTLNVRNVRDHLGSLDMQNIISAQKRQSGNRGGPHYVYELEHSLDLIIESMAESDDYEGAIEAVADNHSLSDFSN